MAKTPFQMSRLELKRVGSKECLAELARREHKPHADRRASRMKKGFALVAMPNPSTTYPFLAGTYSRKTSYGYPVDEPHSRYVIPADYEVTLGEDGSISAKKLKNRFDLFGSHAGRFDEGLPDKVYFPSAMAALEAAAEMEEQARPTQGAFEGGFYAREGRLSSGHVSALDLAHETARFYEQLAYMANRFLPSLGMLRPEIRAAEIRPARKNGTAAQVQAVVDRCSGFSGYKLEYRINKDTLVIEDPKHVGPSTLVLARDGREVYGRLKHWDISRRELGTLVGYLKAHTPKGITNPRTRRNTDLPKNANILETKIEKINGTWYGYVQYSVLDGHPTDMLRGFDSKADAETWLSKKLEPHNLSYLAAIGRGDSDPSLRNPPRLKHKR